MFNIEMSPIALEDLQWFRKREQQRILSGIEEQLRQQPGVATRNRKRLRIGHRTEWELRIDNVRVFYDILVDAALVRIAAIGYKERIKLYFRGQEFQP
jgi:mRNA-degrading endonuclease RelE of RelBE toxin-antitoxin system